MRTDEQGHRKPLAYQKRPHFAPELPPRWRVILRGLLPSGQYVKLKETVLCRPGRGSGRHGPCERCGERVATDAHHRMLVSQGGPDIASNLAALCRVCHDWCHAHPEDARLGGWIVPSHADFRSRALLLWDGLLVTLDDDGGYSFQAPTGVP